MQTQSECVAGEDTSMPFRSLSTDSIVKELTKHLDYGMLVRLSQPEGSTVHKDFIDANKARVCQFLTEYSRQTRTVTGYRRWCRTKPRIVSCIERFKKDSLLYRPEC